LFLSLKNGGGLQRTMMGVGGFRWLSKETDGEREEGTEGKGGKGRVKGREEGKHCTPRGKRKPGCYHFSCYHMLPFGMLPFSFPLFFFFFCFSVDEHECVAVTTLTPRLLWLE
jgi:hypothetical protein